MKGLWSRGVEIGNNRALWQGCENWELEILNWGWVGTFGCVPGGGSGLDVEM